MIFELKLQPRIHSVNSGRESMGSTLTACEATTAPALCVARAAAARNELPAAAALPEKISLFF